jgi:hypothetical protein
VTRCLACTYLDLVSVVEGYFEMVTFHVCPYTWRIGLNYDLHFGLTLENFGPWAINVLILVVRNWAVTRDEMLNPFFFFQIIKKKV